jgi:hypothetical protein
MSTLPVSEKRRVCTKCVRIITLETCDIIDESREENGEYVILHKGNPSLLVKGWQLVRPRPTLQSLKATYPAARYRCPTRGCRELLPEEVESTEDFIIAIAGAVESGKSTYMTQFLRRFVNPEESIGRALGIVSVAPDTTTATRFRELYVDKLSRMDVLTPNEEIATLQSRRSQKGASSPHSDTPVDSSSGTPNTDIDPQLVGAGVEDIGHGAGDSTIPPDAGPDNGNGQSTTDKRAREGGGSADAQPSDGVPTENRRGDAGHDNQARDGANRTFLFEPLKFKVVLGQPEDEETHRAVNLVFYDMSGEDWKREENRAQYVPFVKHADAFILAIDPLAFQVVLDNPDRYAPWIDRMRRKSPGSPYNDTPAFKILEMLARDYRWARGKKSWDPVTIPLAATVMKQDILYHFRDVKVDSMDNHADGSVPQDMKEILGRVQDGKNGAYTFDLDDLRDRHKYVRALVAACDRGNLPRSIEAFWKKHLFFAVSATGGPPGWIKVRNRKTGKISERFMYRRLRPFRELDPLVWLLHELGLSATDAEM